MGFTYEPASDSRSRPRDLRPTEMPPEMPVPQPILIVGASTRAAAQSAVRAGFEPWCLDQFADEDLRACAHILPLGSYPDGLPTAFAAAPDAPWLYAGGLENRPDVVAELASIRPLLGNSAEALRLVRDPIWLAQLLERAQLPRLAVSMTRPTGIEERRWLRKPLRSAGGRDIGFVSDSDEPLTESGVCYQEFAAGLAISGLFLADGQRATCLGLSRQLVGEPITHAPPFGYSGSIAPLGLEDLPAAAFEQAQRLGELVAREAQLVGLIGIDFVWEPSQQIAWLIEVNPRYPASAELYELACGWPLIRWHAEPSAFELPVTENRVRFGKLVLYADRTFRVADLRAVPFADRVTFVADIPQPGSEIECGQPVCTLITQAETTEGCEQRLLAAAIAMNAAMSQDCSFLKTRRSRDLSPLAPFGERGARHSLRESLTGSLTGSRLIRSDTSLSQIGGFATLTQKTTDDNH